MKKCEFLSVRQCFSDVVCLSRLSGAVQRTPAERNLASGGMLYHGGENGVVCMAAGSGFFAGIWLHLKLCSDWTDDPKDTAWVSSGVSVGVTWPIRMRTVLEDRSGDDGAMAQG